MIQVNLLPDVKQEYLRTQQVKHSVIVGSVLASVVSLVLVGLLFAYVELVQPQHRNNLQKDIDSSIAEIKSKPDASKIVTVQGALEQLPALQDKKTITSNLFNYLTAFTPRDVAYSEVKLDLSTGTLSLSGTAKDYEQANVLANNLKSATFTYKTDGSETSIKPFSSVVFQALSKTSQNSSGKSVGFQLTVAVDPTLFDQAITDGSLKVDASSEQLLLPDASLFNSGVNQ